MDKLKKKLEDILETHTKKMVISCDENCMCWEIESLLCDLNMQAEKRRPTTGAVDLLTCPQCEGDLHNGYCQECKAAFEPANH